MQDPEASFFPLYFCITCATTIKVKSHFLPSGLFVRSDLFHNNNISVHFFLSTLPPTCCTYKMWGLLTRAVPCKTFEFEDGVWLQLHMSCESKHCSDFGAINPKWTILCNTNLIWWQRKIIYVIHYLIKHQQIKWTYTELVITDELQVFTRNPALNQDACISV